ncbi:unnamed protein product [Brachionus calyciflorus]|uniref:P/Homo B domain-containing protein n=1 Tax=Brachionus calyciflorus TaxID=104777 RepID=A0A813P5X0_9BILA|nr:unnamed protein product [Brachionus calyciflorus]
MNTGDIDHARRVLRDTGFRVVRQVGNLNAFIVESEHHKISKRSARLESQQAEKILSDPQVELFSREKILSRQKRDFIELPLTAKIVRSVNEKSKTEDPFWGDMWYLNRHWKDSKQFDMNVTGAWNQGYSGKGVSVTFLDDGLEWDHPDILQNYDAKASTDINNHDDDPMPRYDETNENKHGTRCAGEVAAVANNSICSVGIAYNAGIGGIKMLDGDVTDSVEAMSLSFNSQHVSIYSASWGPDDNGEVVDGPGPLARRAFIEGANAGRGGLGSIFVWASGNGGRFEDSCACDGYANSIYTMSISSTSERSQKPWYLEECASTLATTYSSGDERAGEKEIITTDIRHKCTSKHTGTSAAAPIAAGIIALALEANPKLTWRDIMFITVLTSRAKAIVSNNYIQNKRGLLVSSRYGFGLMDAGRMVEVAKNWVNVPKMVTCAVRNSNFQVKTIQKSHIIEAVLTTDACQGSINEVNYIEQVEIIVTVRAQQRGLLEIFLISPMGTKSQILPKRPRDQSADGFKKWSFMSVQTWGEFPKGDWVLNVGSSDGSQVQLEDYELVIHGTKEKPVEYEKFLNNDEMTPLNSTTTSQASRTATLNQPDRSSNALIKPNPCSECSGPLKSNCTLCLDGSFLSLETNECVQTCPTGYFSNNKNECEKCDDTCETCEFSPSYCLTCKSLNVQQYSVVYKNNYCVINKKNNECDLGEYFDASSTECKRCDLTCSECKSNTAESCLSCSDSRRPFLNEGQCVTNCENGFYLNSTLQRCFKCSDNCKTCKSDANECIECKIGFKLNDKNLCEKIINANCSDPNCQQCLSKEKNQCQICKNGM